MSIESVVRNDIRRNPYREHLSVIAENEVARPAVPVGLYSLRSPSPADLAKDGMWVSAFGNDPFCNPICRVKEIFAAAQIN